MMMMMKAAIYEEFGGKISVQQVPLPQCPADGVVIRVMATGVCRSDWHGWKGRDGDVHAHGLPFCPGHEFSGIVVQAAEAGAAGAAGAGAAGAGAGAGAGGGAAAAGGTSRRNIIQVGDRVAVPFILSCGACRYCQPPRNQPTICAHQKQPGFTQWGSFAEYVAVPRADRNLRKLPANVSFVQAAALGCRVTTAYRAVYQQGQLSEGQSVGVFGCGGLGLSCVMLAVARRAKIVVAVDVSLPALEKAKTLGATHAVQVQAGQSSEAIAQAVLKMLREETNDDNDDNDGLDLTLDAAGFATTSEAAVYATRPGGIMVQVGLPHTTPHPSIPMSRVAGKEITIVGSHGFDANVLPELLELVANTPSLDPCQLVQAEVSLEEGCKALEAMDRESPLGMVMITNFDDDKTSPKISASRL
jgi:alcohol dehydrogenase